jgi:hypothetical protein
MSQHKDLKVRGHSAADVWDFENAFYWFSQPSRVHKLMAHYDLYQKIIELPGDVFELGVYKAAWLLRFATFRNSLENDTARKIVGFDAFGKFPRDAVADIDDHKFIDRFETSGGDGLSKAEVEQLIEHKGFRNIELVERNVLQTLDIYLKQLPHTRLALLHLDMDVKEPTAYALHRLYDYVVPGGLIVIDDYGTVVGATEAVDLFSKMHGLPIHKNRDYKVPSYIVKPL